MIDPRIATNLLIFLKPQIEQATWLLEAVRELQAIASPSAPIMTPAPVDLPGTANVPVDVQGKTAEQYIAETEQKAA